MRTAPGRVFSERRLHVSDTVGVGALTGLHMVMKIYDVRHRASREKKLGMSKENMRYISAR